MGSYIKRIGCDQKISLYSRPARQMDQIRELYPGIKPCKFSTEVRRAAMATRRRVHQALRPVLLLLLAPRLAAVSHTRLSRRAAVASSVLCSSLLLPRAAEASDFQTAESATASQFAAAEAARASRQRDSFELRRAFELKVSAVQDATTAREFVVASDAQAHVEDKAGRAGLPYHAYQLAEAGCPSLKAALRLLWRWRGVPSGESAAASGRLFST